MKERPNSPSLAYKIAGVVAVASIAVSQAVERFGYKASTSESASQPQTCEGIDYDPNIGSLIRLDGTLIGVGTDGQGVLLDSDRTVFDNGTVDLIYHTVSGKKTHIDAARFTPTDGRSSTKVLGFDDTESRVICIPDN